MDQGRTKVPYTVRPERLPERTEAFCVGEPHMDERVPTTWDVMPKKPQTTEVSYEHAIRDAFVTLCAQYQEMGKQLEVIARLIHPLIEGEYRIEPPVKLVAKDNPDKLN